MQTAYVIARIQQLVNAWPPERIERLAEAVAQSQGHDWGRLQANINAAIPQAERRDEAQALLQLWKTHSPTLAPESVALALRAAAATAVYQRQFQQLEPVWTGPDSGVIPLRRTDQALLEIIQGAKERLHIVSFAVYKAVTITEALVAAAHRGVRINIYLETSEASEGKMAYDTIKALGQAVRQQACIYTWPFDKRPLSPEGKHGSLHAKIALADGEHLLLSSANLTEYALTLNMEMGVMIHRGRVPAQVERHLQRLVELAIFVPTSG